jgi:hypothetical protein
MAITYDWRVEQMECYPQHEGHTDVVFTVHWRVNAADGNHNATSYGSVGVTLEPDADFTPYDNLTQSQVIGWVKDALGEEQVTRIETALDGQIADQINPPVVRPALPWVA